MILKIECYRQEGMETFLTDVRTVRYMGTVRTQQGDTPQEDDTTAACGCCAEYDYDFRGRLHAGKPDGVPYFWREIVAETSNGTKIIALDGYAYLMSDTGKTIESIKN